MTRHVFLAAVLCALAGGAMFGKQAPAPAPAPAPAAAPTETSAQASEAAAWKSIRSSSDPTDFMTYLKQYPNGAHVTQAMERVESYAVGLNFGLLLMKQPVDYDTSSVVRGVEEEMGGGKTLLSDAQVNAALTELQAQEDSNKDKRVQAGETASYAIGMNFARKLVHQDLGLDGSSVAHAVKDILLGNKPLVTNEIEEGALDDLSLRATVKQDELRNQAGQASLKQGAEFLANNAKKEGVVVLPSGLQYKILTRGTGPKPKANDTVICEYSGTLIDGKEFENSDKDPSIFVVSDAIPGWAEALQLMPVGSKWQLFIPPDLAYGAVGKSPDVGPNATILLEVQLVAIQPKT